MKRAVHLHPPTPRSISPAGRQAGFAPVEKGRLYYETAGAGEAVVLIHGNAGDHRHWDLQFEVFGKYFQTVRYDVRGYGQSSMPVEGERYAHHEDLAALLDHLKIPSAHIVGWSMGSGKAIDFALVHPDKVKSLVLFGPWISGYTSPAVQAFSSDMAPVQAALAAGGRVAAAHAWMSTPSFHNTIRGRVAGDRFSAIAGDYSFWHFAHRDPRRTIQPGAAGRLAEIRAPVLIVTAEHDIPACLEIADVLANTLPHCRKVILAGIGHLLHMEKPAEFNRVVLEFIRCVGQDR